MIIAFDIGDKRIGVAISDPFESYAMPSETYFRTGKTEEDVKSLLAFAKGYGADMIVCGLPLNSDGSDSVQTDKARRFAAALGQAGDIPVLLQDERYTTCAARGDLLRFGVSTKKDKKKKRVDSLAAAYILEGYLATRKRGGNT